MKLRPADENKYRDPQPDNVQILEHSALHRMSSSNLSLQETLRRGVQKRVSATVKDMEDTRASEQSRTHAHKDSKKPGQHVQAFTRWHFRAGKISAHMPPSKA